jgi:hypothetical protein
MILKLAFSHIFFKLYMSFLSLFLSQLRDSCGDSSRDKSEVHSAPTTPRSSWNKVCVCVYVCVCVCVNVGTYIYICIYTHINISHIKCAYVHVCDISNITHR